MPAKGLQLLAFVVALMFAPAAFAQQQRPSMLGNSFDLKGAILSPAPLGPPSQLEPPVAAAAPQVAPSAAAQQEAAAPRKTVSSKPRQKPSVAARKPKANPLDSYARDPQRQIWPCRGGGICAWTQPR
jgi:hypothetical protein